jgi:hypothetical protein
LEDRIKGCVAFPYTSAFEEALHTLLGGLRLHEKGS